MSSNRRSRFVAEIDPGLSDIGLTAWRLIAPCGMKALRTPQIVAVEKLRDGVLIEFDDRKCAIYTASLLHTYIPQAIKVKNIEPRNSTNRERAGLKVSE